TLLRGLLLVLLGRVVAATGHVLVDHVADHPADHPADPRADHVADKSQDRPDPPAALPATAQEPAQKSADSAAATTAENAAEIHVLLQGGSQIQWDCLQLKSLSVRVADQFPWSQEIWNQASLAC